MKVLIATDGTPYAHAAIREAARLLPLAAAEVHVVAAANLVPGRMAYPTTSAVASLIARDLATAADDVAKALGLLGELGIAGTGHTREGEPAPEIGAVARAIGADLVVVGAHGKNAFERWLLGSTSEAVLHRSEVPVLIIRPRA